MSDFKDRLESIIRGAQTSPLDQKAITRQLSAGDHKDVRVGDYGKIFDDMMRTIRKIALRYGQESFPDEVDATQHALDTLATLWDEFSNSHRSFMRGKTSAILNDNQAATIEQRFVQAMNQIIELTQDEWKKMKNEKKMKIYKDVAGSHSALSKYQGGHVVRFVKQKYKMMREL
ncbi:hypothetical protein HY621_01660 [Candidatus Uhrbacteria bacterium]|nr:hypothetical protein [Candidatus Uhrbacteria bacterium]